MSQRAQVLTLYRHILRIGKKWEGPESEKKYIREEAQQLFRQNKNITNPEIIEKKIREAETRIALALHYKIPYPRLYFIPKGRRILFHSFCYSRNIFVSKIVF
jgi:hypothetical protein